jgi:hypothetical protein
MLPSAVHLWPTPHAADSTGGKIRKNMSPTGRMPDGSKATVSLNQAATRFWCTPIAYDGQQQHNRKGTERRLEIGKTISLGMQMSMVEASGQLNPEWVAQLMGLPAGWLDIPGPPVPAKTRTRGKRPALPAASPSA